MPKALFKSKNGGKITAAKMAEAGAVGSSDQPALPATSADRARAHSSKDHSRKTKHSKPSVASQRMRGRETRPSRRFVIGPISIEPLPQISSLTPLLLTGSSAEICHQRELQISFLCSFPLAISNAELWGSSTKELENVSQAPIAFPSAILIPTNAEVCLDTSKDFPLPDNIKDFIAVAIRRCIFETFQQPRKAYSELSGYSNSCMDLEQEEFPPCQSPGFPLWEVCHHFLGKWNSAS